MIRKILKWGLIALAVIFVLAALGGDKKEEGAPSADKAQVEAEKPEGLASRPFYMGFTPWPSDMTLEGVKATNDFVRAHGDIVAVHYDGGVPWPEAYEGKELPKHLRDDWNGKKDVVKGKEVYLAITPLAFERDRLAQRWASDGDNKPLPEEWAGYRLNDEHVKTAFLNYARQAIRHFKPKYAAIGIETNIVISKAPEKWDDYVELHSFVYDALKREFPDVLIFPTVQYEHLRGIENDAKKNVVMQMPKVRELMKKSDLLALSTYRFGKGHNDPSPEYFKPALSLGKPIAISETGAPSKEFKIFGWPIKGSPEDQKEYVSFILSEAAKHDFEFVINWVNIDYEKLLDKFPAEMKEIGKAWVYTGLVSADGNPKPALSVWDGFLSLPRK